METSTSGTRSTSSTSTAKAGANGVRVRTSSTRTSRARTTKARKPGAARVTRKVTPVVEATVTARTKPSRTRMDARTFVLASIGAGELAVSTARTASEKVVEMTRNPMGMQAVADSVVTDVMRMIGDLAVRGEKLVDGMQDSVYTKRAMGQTKIARSQVKAASTSIRKAVDTATVAAREAVKKVS